MRNRRASFGLSLRWIAFSYLIVAGMLMLLQATVAVHPIGSRYVEFILHGIAGFLGGFLAGRASPRKTLYEPAVGALFVVVTMTLFVEYLGIPTVGGNVVHPALPVSVAIVAFAAAVAGAGLGERHARPRSSETTWWWASLGFVAIVGSCFVFGVVGAALNRFVVAGWIVGIPTIVLSPAIAGVVLQLAAPFPIARKLLRSCLVLGAWVAVMVLLGEEGVSVSSVIGTVFGSLLIALGGLVFTGIAAGGAAWVWRRHRNWIEAAPSQLPESRALAE